MALINEVQPGSSPRLRMAPLKHMRAVPVIPRFVGHFLACMERSIRYDIGGRIRRGLFVIRARKQGTAAITQVTKNTIIKK